jgi:predicted DNA-binding transcriptional regulator AlpA
LADPDELRAGTHMDRLLLPIPDTLHALGIGRTTLYELFDEQKIERVKIGRRSFVTVKSLTAYVDSLSEAATA